jgi:citrate lyase beta subunit
LDVALRGVTSSDWKRDVQQALNRLIVVLREHGQAAELIGSVESAQGHSRGVTRLAATHEALIAEAADLQQRLGSSPNPAARQSPFRRDAARLASALRSQDAEESDLISETALRVSGGEG